MIIKHSEDMSEVFSALAKAQGEIENVEKTKDNPFFKSKYADLATVLLAVRPTLAKHDLCIIQMPVSSEAGEIAVATMIGHKSGQYIMSALPCKPAKTDAQSIGSVITYLRRYSASSMVGIAQEDDDGNAGSMAPNGKPQEKIQQTKPKTQNADEEKYKVVANTADEFYDGFMFRLDQMPTVDDVNKLLSAQSAGVNRMKTEDKDRHAVLMAAVEKKRNVLAQKP